MTKTARLPIGDLTLNVRRSGRGRPVLLLHGFPDSLVLWRKVVPLLAAQGHSVISYDQRGFGHSDAPSGKLHYTISRIVEDAVRVLTALEISEPVDVIGHDWGAVIGWCLCLSHPDLVRRHVAISVGHPRAYATAGLRQKRMGLYTLAFQFPGVAEARLAHNDYAGLRAWLRRSGHPDEEGIIGELSRTGRLTAGLNYYRANLLPVMMRRWPACRVPTMGIWGDQDPYLAEDQMVHSERHMEAAWRYERIAGSGHWLPLECPRRVAGLALDWFAGGD